MMNFIKAWLGMKADSQTFAFGHSPNFDGIPVEVAPSEYGGEHPCEDPRNDLVNPNTNCRRAIA